MTNEEIQNLVIQWADERFIKDLPTQAIKFYEEYGELCADYLKGRDMTDSIGDTAITLIIYAQIKGEHIVFDYDAYDNELDHEEILLSMPRLDNDDCVQDTINLLMEFSYRMDYDINTCLNHAWNEIKDRRGKTVNGSFIREDVR